jgi:hypothetical protein
MELLKHAFLGSSGSDDIDQGLKNKEATTLTLFVLVSLIVFVLLWLSALYFYNNFGGPIKVSFDTLGDSSVRVTWKSSFPAKTRVEYGTATYYNNSTEINEEYGTEGDHVVSGLLPDKGHAFKVVAYDENGKVYSSRFHWVN